MPSTLNLNDPFGRLRKRDEAAYDSLRRRLAAAGITTPAAIDAVRRRGIRNTLAFGTAVVIATPIVCLLLPQLAPVILATAALALAAAAKAAAQGQRLLCRLRDDAGSEQRPG